MITSSSPGREKLLEVFIILRKVLKPAWREKKRIRDWWITQSVYMVLGGCPGIVFMFLQM